MAVTIVTGDALEQLRLLPSDSVHCCVTSPPYYGLRDYGVAGQIGLEPSPDEYVAALAAVFREVRRVMRPDGTLWLNIGDSYNAHPGQRKTTDKVGAKQETNSGSNTIGSRHVEGIKPKDLLGIPWLVAFALRADGWWLRQDIIWSKPNPMPESVTDRCTKAHEYLFLLSKSERYWFDAAAIAEQASYAGGRLESPYSPPGQEPHHGASNAWQGKHKADKQRGHGRRHAGFNERWDQMERSAQCTGFRNKRDVWEVSPAPFSEAHFATFPPALIEPCILAGCPKDGTVLDCFSGAGTTGLVADRLGRDAVLIELNPLYAQMAQRRIHGDAPLFADVAMHSPASECAA